MSSIGGDDQRNWRFGNAGQFLVVRASCMPAGRDQGARASIKGKEWVNSHSGGNP